MDHHLGSFLDHICQVQSRASVTEGATSNLGDSARREFVSAKTTEEQSPHTQIMTSRTFVCSVKFGFCGWVWSNMGIWTTLFDGWQFDVDLSISNGCLKIYVHHRNGMVGLMVLGKGWKRGITNPNNKDATRSLFWGRNKGFDRRKVTARALVKNPKAWGPGSLKFLFLNTGKFALQQAEGPSNS